MRYENMKLDTILFDLDGTVLNTNHLIIESFQHTYKMITGVERSIDYIVKSFGEPLAVTMKREFDIPVEEAIKIYRDFHYDQFENLIDIFAGIEEEVKNLYEKGYKLGIVTSRLKNTTIRGLKKYNLDQYFHCIVTADDSKKHKPDPEPILIALEMLESRPENVIMIGDSIFDIQCAKNAGVRSAVVTWSALPKESYLSENPDYIIEKTEDITMILENINMTQEKEDR